MRCALVIRPCTSDLAMVTERRRRSAKEVINMQIASLETFVGFQAIASKPDGDLLLWCDQNMKICQTAREKPEKVNKMCQAVLSGSCQLAKMGPNYRTFYFLSVRWHTVLDSYFVIMVTAATYFVILPVIAVHSLPDRAWVSGRAVTRQGEVNHRWCLRDETSQRPKSVWSCSRNYIPSNSEQVMVTSSNLYQQRLSFVLCKGVAERLQHTSNCPTATSVASNDGTLDLLANYVTLAGVARASNIQDICLWVPPVMEW